MSIYNYKIQDIKKALAEKYGANYMLTVVVNKFLPADSFTDRQILQAADEQFINSTEPRRCASVN